MNAVDSIFSEQLLQQTETPAAPKKNELGQDEFLKLMLAQLKHQDPFKPVENGEFVAQMAQFSTVAGIENMDKSLTGMSQAFSGNQLLQSSALIGRTALVPGSTATLGAESGIDAYYKLEESTSALALDIHNSAGELVHHSELAAKSRGMHRLQWDGMLADGSRAPSGTYSLSVTQGPDGNQSLASILTENKISTVSLAPGDNSIKFETEEGNTVSLEEIEKLQ